MKKIIIACAAAAGVLAIALVVYFVVLSNKTDSYREIKIYKVDGSTSVERSGDQTLDAYENMQLMNEDHVSVMAESYTQLKMDEDKYALLEPLTSIMLEATGDSEDSETRITLEKGSIVNSIEQPLSPKSVYEVNSSNSTMAVRGTSFKVDTYYDDQGVSHTTLVVIEGNVECYLVYPDGSRSEGRTFKPGMKVIIRGDNSTTEYEFEGAADLKELSLEALEFLKLHYNEEFFCTEQEINDAIEERRNSQLGDTDNAGEDNNGDNTDVDNTEENPSGQDAGNDGSSTDNTEESNNQEDNASSSDNDENIDDNSNNSEDNKASEDTDKKDDDDKDKDKDKNDKDKDDKDKVDDKSDKDTDDKDKTDKATDDKSTDNADKKDNTDNNDTNKNDEKKEDKKTEYTATFIYNGDAFATQKVEEGGKVKEPVLNPSNKGGWDYNFGTEVKGDVSITWDENK